jgi:cysteine desulfurase
MEERIYLDNAATTPIDPEVVEAMIPVLKEYYGNPSSTHAHGRKVKALIEESRSKVAALLGCTPGEIIFTSGGTEADNMALRGSVNTLGVQHIITSPIEHHAVLHTVEELHHDGKAQMHLVQLDAHGHVDFAHLESLLQQYPNALVSLMHGNNEIGNLLDLERVGALCRKYQAYFHTDTVQTMGHYSFRLSEMPIDFLACGAHKFNGPKGIGFIYMNRNSRVRPFITGGAQEREMRGGTENVYGIVGLAKALEIAYRDLEQKKAHITALKTEMIQALKKNIADIRFNGDAEGASLYTVLSASFPSSAQGDMLLFNLDLAGISASGGSACSSGATGGSHVMKGIGADPLRTTVRFSFGKYNTSEEIQKTVQALTQWYPAPIAVGHQG